MYGTSSDSQKYSRSVLQDMHDGHCGAIAQTDKTGARGILTASLFKSESEVSF